MKKFINMLTVMVLGIVVAITSGCGKAHKFVEQDLDLNEEVKVLETTITDAETKIKANMDENRELVEKTRIAAEEFVKASKVMAERADIELAARDRALEKYNAELVALRESGEGIDKKIAKLEKAAARMMGQDQPKKEVEEKIETTVPAPEAPKVIDAPEIKKEVEHPATEPETVSEAPATDNV